MSTKNTGTYTLDQVMEVFLYGVSCGAASEAFNANRGKLTRRAAANRGTNLATQAARDTDALAASREAVVQMLNDSTNADGYTPQPGTDAPMVNGQVRVAASGQTVARQEGFWYTAGSEHYGQYTDDDVRGWRVVFTPTEEAR